MLRPNQPADAPASGVEVLACGANREGQIGDFGGQAAYAGKGNVIEAVVDLVGRFSWKSQGILLGKSREIAYLIREYNYIVFDADVSNGLQLVFRKYFSNRIMAATCQ